MLTVRLTGAGRENTRGASAVFFPRTCSVCTEITCCSAPSAPMQRAKETFTGPQPGAAILPCRSSAR